MFGDVSLSGEIINNEAEFGLENCFCGAKNERRKLVKSIERLRVCEL